MNSSPRIAILGTFVADLAFRADRLPTWGETVLGSAFRMGPGGKGSNQAVAAARLGASVSMISKVGLDEFGNIARRTWADEGIDTRFVIDTAEFATGSSTITVNEKTGDNAIVVVPGSGFHITCAELDHARDAIADSVMFMTCLELPMDVVRHGLALAKSLGVPTILNPAPAQLLADDIYPLCDYITPNESEATRLTGVAVSDAESADGAAEVLLSRGAPCVIVTLGERGALIKTAMITAHVPAFRAGTVLETTGAGDAFNAGLAVALAEGANIPDAVRFGCATAAICVTRYGTTPAMPGRGEVAALAGV
ncbi:MAG TPA: ribokinase [Gemmatimonadaceae bacterium]|nr:ribokinase [Gemmatimonadaceae bacterium]